MKFFHRTTAKASRAILKTGFRDAAGPYLMEGFKVRGVFVSDVPPDDQEGANAKCDTLLQIDVKISGEDLGFYELKEDGKPNREWCIPANILNGAAFHSTAHDHEVD